MKGLSFLLLKSYGRPYHGKHSNAAVENQVSWTGLSWYVPDICQLCLKTILNVIRVLSNIFYTADESQMDIIDECIGLFRANCFFRNFEIKGPADRTLIYGTLFISECLGRVNGLNYRDAERQLNSLALENFSIPGSAGFPLNALYAPPLSPQDAGKIHPNCGIRHIDVCAANSFLAFFFIC